MKKKKIIKFLKVLICLLVIVIIILFGSLYFRKNNNNVENKLIGIWTTDGVTKYEFIDDKSGKLIVSLGEYKFNYTVDGDKLSIDFVNEKSEDSTYTYKIEDDKLILNGSNGEFKFKKIVN